MLQELDTRTRETLERIDEKLPQFRSQVSKDFGPWGPEVRVTHEMINHYGGLTGDDQWIHTDIDKAAKGPFGGVIAQGFLTLGLIAKMQKEQLAKLEEGNGVRLIHRCGGYNFLLPVRAGSSIHACGRLERADKNTMFKALELNYLYRIAAVGQGKLSVTGVMTLLWFP